MKKYREEDRALAERFTYNMRKRMEELDFTQTELSKRSGVSQPHISQILRHARIPIITTANRIAKALGVGLQDLLK